MSGATWLSPEQAGRAMRGSLGKGIKVAVIDSGVEASHPALDGVQLADDFAIVLDRQTAPEAAIGSFRVLDGRNAAKSHAVCRAAMLAIERGYHIINCSIGAGIKEQVLMYKEWVDRAYLAGVHIVAACNNLDFRRLEWPGHFSSVITVNMLRDAAGDGLYLNHPGSLVEFAALGAGVRVPWKGGLTIETTGSSFAAPRVAGLLARLLSAHPELKPLQAKELLRAIAAPHP